MGKKGTVEVHLTGGLGNQLFQYSAGKFLSELIGSKLLLNLNRVARHHSDSNFDISSFSITDDHTRFKIVRSRKMDLLRTRIIRDFGSSVQFKCTEFLNIENFEDYIVNDPISNNVHLFGYFGDFSFFDSIGSAKNSLILSKPSMWYLESLSERQNGFNAIHMRLGDYTENVDHYGILSPSYYERILESLDTDNRKLPTLVFSDDAHSARRLLSSEANYHYIFVEPPSAADPAESLLFMSKARNLIVANSTFSYWAAKLAAPSSRIYVPESNPSGQEFVRNLPSSWEKVPAEWIKADQLSSTLNLDI